jgi:hypothetical protein
MDAEIVKKHLAEVNEQLGQLDEERDVLVSLVRGYEGWLRLHGHTNGSKPKEAMPIPLPIKSPAKRGRTAIQGKVSMRSAVQTVLQRAHGEPIHAREILARARSMGAETSAKNPEAVIDLVCYTLKQRKKAPLERIGPMTWRWVGG